MSPGWWKLKLNPTIVVKQKKSVEMKHPTAHVYVIAHINLSLFGSLSQSDDLLINISTIKTDMTVIKVILQNNTLDLFNFPSQEVTPTNCEGSTKESQKAKNNSIVT